MAGQFKFVLTQAKGIDVDMNEKLKEPFLYTFVLKVILFLTFILFLNSTSESLSGIHAHRQSDTLFTAYSFCVGDSSFFYPKLSFRGDTPGVAIGELPIFSALVAAPCLLTGYWSELFPKIFSLLLFVIAILLGMKLYEGRFHTKLKHKLDLFVIAVSVSLFLAHLTIPIPDSLALVLMLSAGVLSLKRNLNSLIFAVVLFTLGFAIRPYLAPLVFLVFTQRSMQIISTVFCAAFYLLWFKWWDTKVTDIPYYAIHVANPIETLKILPSLLGDLLQALFRNVWNYVLFIPFVIGFYKKPIWGLYFVMSVCFIVLFRADHWINHNYYFMSSAVISTFVVWYVLESVLRTTARRTLVILSILIGLASVQHLWHHSQHRWDQVLPEMVATHNIQWEERVAVVMPFNPQYFYWMKRIGGFWEPEGLATTDFRLHCPQWASWVLYRPDVDVDVLAMDKCAR